LKYVCSTITAVADPEWQIYSATVNRTMLMLKGCWNVPCVSDIFT